MKSILQSIKSQYCELIASGKKTIEVRKTRPKCELPVKVYIYCTKGGKPIYLNDAENEALLNGKVIGEYVCDNIEPKYCANGIATYYENEQGTCLFDAELQMYADGVKPLYFWHISDLVIYDKPKELSEFRYYYCKAKMENGYPMPTHEITRPPQSWCYVEEIQE